MHIRFDGYEIGCTHDSEVFIAEYEISETEIETDDTNVLGADGVMPSNDYLRESTWQFALTVHDQEGTHGVLNKLAPLERAWKNWANRSRGTVALEYSTGHDGVWHRVYGRPRRYLPPRPDAQTAKGRGHAQISFQQQDPLHYSAPQTATLLPTASSFAGGWAVPFEFPLVASGTSVPTAAAVNNTGTEPAPIQVTFHGPSVNPRVWAGAIEVQYNGALAHDEYVTIDGKNYSVHLHGAGRAQPVAVPGRLSPHTLLTDLVVPPGETHWWYEAIDETVQSKATFTWLNAYQSMQ